MAKDGRGIHGILGLPIIRNLALPFRLFGRAIRNFGAQEERSTWSRFWRSRHVADLSALTFLLMLFIVLGFLAITYYDWRVYQISVPAFTATASGDHYIWLEHLIWPSALVAAGAIPVISIVYQIASKRLGVVDLFSSEITSLCRTYQVVNFAPVLVHLYEDIKSLAAPAPADPTAWARTFGATATRLAGFKVGQSFTPVLDSSTADLANLDAVVVSQVSAFYTYRLSMIEYMARIADTQAPTPQQLRDDALVGHDYLQRVDYLLFQVIYMLFLSLESGRKAVQELVEYEPNHAEATLNILIGELICRDFLIRQISAAPPPATGEDVRLARLRARHPEYVRLCADLAVTVTTRYRKAETALHDAHLPGADPGTTAARLRQAEKTRDLWKPGWIMLQEAMKLPAWPQ
jgi:hypothetical protein